MVFLKHISDHVTRCGLLKPFMIWLLPLQPHHVVLFTMLHPSALPPGCIWLFLIKSAISNSSLYAFPSAPFPLYCLTPIFPSGVSSGWSEHHVWKSSFTPQCWLTAPAFCPRNTMYLPRSYPHTVFVILCSLVFSSSTEFYEGRNCLLLCIPGSVYSINV